MKQCTQCKEIKPYLEFHKIKNNKISAQCKKCVNARNKKYALKNSKKIKELKKKYRQKNIKKLDENLKLWHKNNPEKRTQYNHKRRVSQLGNGYSFYTIKDVLNTYGTKCHICKQEINLKAKRKSGQIGWEFSLHIDHLVAIANGGSDTLQNVRPSHGKCNLEKGTSDSA
tara:strand:+ start:73 stop:582 length:510 start_codon:yes stop_codon:yes gene_type:complete